MARSLKLRELGDVGQPFAAGGQGAVYRVRHKGRDVVFKRFNAPLDPGPIAALVEFRDAVEKSKDPLPRRAVLDIAVWPSDLVMSGSDCVGLLMPEADPGFKGTEFLNAGPSTKNQTLMHLFMPPESLAGSDFWVPRWVDRLCILRDTALFLSVVNKNEFVYGDLSGNNAAFRKKAGSKPWVVFFDCDVIFSPSRGITPQQVAHTPMFFPPDAERMSPTTATDRYKFGLLVAYVLSPVLPDLERKDVSKRLVAAAGILSTLDGTGEGKALLFKSVDSAPSVRPSCGEWFRYLESLVPLVERKERSSKSKLEVNGQLSSTTLARERGGVAPAAPGPQALPRPVRPQLPRNFGNNRIGRPGARPQQPVPQPARTTSWWSRHKRKVKWVAVILVVYVGGNQVARWRAGTETRPVVTVPPPELTAGDDPEYGASRTSANGYYKLSLQNDGNLVLTGSRPLWASGTDGNYNAFAAMQDDGNLVIYSYEGSPVWNSGTAGNAGAQLVLQDDGNLVIYSADGRPLWSTNTAS